LALLLLRGSAMTSDRNKRGIAILAASFAAILLLLLITAWFDVTLSEAWLSADRWLHFPALFLTFLPYHAAEEYLLGPAAVRPRWRRLALGLALRFIIWIAVLVGIFALQSGELLLVLMAPYLATVCLLQRAGMDVVRKDTGSPLAAAFFGAILLAGFCLVVFPII
jgi:hypothetical protein